MKRIDRVFILFLVLVLCGVAMRSIRDFGQRRAFNGINVVGEGKIEMPADMLVMSFEFISTGDQNVDMVAKHQTKFQELLSGLSQFGITWSDVVELYSYNGYGCRISQRWSMDWWFYWENPCYRQTLEITLRGSGFVDHAQNILSFLEEYPNISTYGRRLQIENDEQYRAEARLLALEHARTQGEFVASQLWAKLGKLISASEYGFNNTNYYPDNQYNGTFYFDGNILPQNDISITIPMYVIYAVR